MDDGTDQPSDEWLKSTNEKLSREEVPHARRPWEAWLSWCEDAGVSSSLNDPDVKRIFDWFEQNTKAGSQRFGPLYVGSFYYDTCFWPVFIPVVVGKRTLDPTKSLRTMPASIKQRLQRDRHEFTHYLSVWADCVDFAFGVEACMRSACPNAFSRELFKSGTQELNETVTLLHERTPNPSAYESARMTTEKFLKAFPASKNRLTEREAIKVFGHNLIRLLTRCLEVDGKSELRAIRTELNRLPQVRERYTGAHRTNVQLWHAYSVAQFAAATVVRSVTGRDCRNSVRTTRA